jgi:site-specific DNA-methyltransferase (adenine-specific)
MNDIFNTDVPLKTETPAFAKHVLPAVPSSEVYLEDCVTALKRYADNHFDLAIVDPPYGLGDRLSNGGGKRKDDPSRLLYVDKQWDILPTAEYWNELFRVSKNQVVFGANYFLEFLPNTRGFVCWDKKQDMPTLSACELVWTSLDKPAKIMKKSSMDLDRFHPTQKPIYVYEWMFKYCKTQENDLILDTHLGSGSSRIAAYKGGFNFVGFEIDQEYYEKQEKRFNDFKSQLRLF